MQMKFKKMNECVSMQERPTTVLDGRGGREGQSCFRLRNGENPTQGGIAEILAVICDSVASRSVEKILDCNRGKATLWYLRSLIIEGNSVLSKWARRCSSGMDKSFRQEGKVVCHILWFHCHDWVNFWPLRKFVKGTCNLPGFFIPEKGFGGRASGTDSPKTLKLCFLAYVTTNLTSTFQGLGLSCLASEKSHIDRATQEQGLFGSTCGFSGTKVKK